ncbi:MAG: hypothetical protein KJ015_09830 [Myxococcales bacterium]|nr:hypothetical protein [Myxococcales bacterium]
MSHTIDFTFTAEARLYAEHAALVEEMRKAFRESGLAFVNVLSTAMAARLHPTKLRSRVTERWAYWWLAADERAEKDQFGQLYLGWDDPDIVRAGKLQAWASAPAARGEDVTELVELSSDPRLARWCKPARTGTKTSLFAIDVEFSPDRPDVESIAGALGEALSVLTEKYDRLRSAKTKGPRSAP